MCLGVKPPKIQPPPALMKKPEPPKKTAQVTKKPSRDVGSGKNKRRRGMSRQALVVNKPTPPSGVNNSSGGVGVYG